MKLPHLFPKLVKTACIPCCIAMLAMGSTPIFAADATTSAPAKPSDPKDSKQITAPTEKPAAPWAFRIGAPLWVSAISGSVGVRGRVSNAAYVPFNDLFNKLDYSIPGSLEVGYGKWGVLLDGQYTKLSDNLNTRDILFNSASVQFAQAFAEFNLSYKVVDSDKLTVAPFIGTRYEYVKLSGQASATKLGTILGAPSSFDESKSTDWADPILGVQAQYQVFKPTAIVAKADVGGFGAASKLTYQFFAGQRTQITRSFYMESGYRYLQTDYTSGGFTWNIAYSGPQITCGINF